MLYLRNALPLPLYTQGTVTNRYFGKSNCSAFDDRRSAANGTPSDRPNPNHYVMRFRLDDGRYRGFHQNNPDELRTGDAVQAENDRIRAEHRARGRDLYP